MSTFAWIDSSAEDRRRVLDAIESLKESDSRDELGLATIRDGFSNELFPGTGTLQTRTSYFLFVAWMYQAMHERNVSGRDAAQVARREELKLIGALLESDDTLGVIGSVARDSLKRLPSSIYWNGLREWGVLQRPLTLEQYHRNFESFALEGDEARDDDRQLNSGSGRPVWHGALPPRPDEFPKKATFALRARDRAYLTERIHLSNGRSLLSWLLRHATTVDAPTPWHHPQLAEFPAHIAEALRHARNFSDAMYGAPYLYNLMLAEKAGAPAEQIERYRSGLAEWGAELAPRAAELASWSLKDLWAHLSPLINVSPSTIDFVSEWVRLHGWEAPEKLAANTTARRLIEERERRLKGGRARLQNQRALELWSGDAGLRRLIYRWPSAVQVLSDLRPELVPHAES